MVNYEFLLQNQLIRPLETVEKEKYAQFHKQNYKIDLASIQQFLELQNAKYTVIAGYYAVLNATLWYFAKYYNLKISEAQLFIENVVKPYIYILEHLPC